MSKYCRNCGSVVDDNAKFCTSCGAQLVQEEPQQPVEPSAAVSNSDPSQPVYNQSGNAVPGWETSVGLSIVGIVAASILAGYFESSSNDGGFLGGILGLAYAVCAIVYALAFYPKYFNNQKVENSKLTSFLNCFFGGIIFGCIWNSNLTKNHKGISHIVFVVLIPCLVILALILISLGLLAYSVTL